jgi:hypothetical protein
MMEWKTPTDQLRRRSLPHDLLDLFMLYLQPPLSKPLPPIANGGSLMAFSFRLL